MALADAWSFSLGVLCLGYLLVRFFYLPRKSRSVPPPGWNVGPKPWDLIDVAQVTIALLALLLLTNASYFLVAAVTHRSLTELVPLVLSTEVVVRVGVLIALAAFFGRRRISFFSLLGFRAIAPLDAAGWALVFGLASLAPVQLTLLALDRIFQLLRINPSEQQIAELFTTADSQWVLALLALFAVVIAPLFEEVFFRGFLYPALKQRFGIGRGLVLVSAIFALSHAHLPSVVPLFVLALGLGLAYEITGSLLVPIGMHALFNGIMIFKLILQRTQ